MNILGIETSCDETAAAIVKDGRQIVSNVVASQIDIHREFGGVVPEVAARSHIETILPVIDKALSEAFPSRLQGQALQTWLRDQIDGIAVTYGPGLPGALLIGVLTARTLAWVFDKPLYAVDHVEAHTYANFLDTSSPPEFPILSLIVSGGHSQLVLMRDHHRYEVLGKTADDAAGEAFDKVAKLLGLGYPGGPAVAEAAKQGDPSKYQFTKPKLAQAYDFSFSGLKTAVLRQAQALAGHDHTFPSYQLAPLLTSTQKQDLAASFQYAIVGMMVDNTSRAYDRFHPRSVVIAGGVAANQELRKQLQRRLPVDITYAPPRLCTDNAAMIASLGFWHTQGKKVVDRFTLEPSPSLSMT